MRLALATILSGKQDNCLVVAGTVCSTFVRINAGTHGRSMIDPLGRQELPSVRNGNLLVSRLLGCISFTTSVVVVLSLVIVCYDTYRISGRPFRGIRTDFRLEVGLG